MKRVVRNGRVRIRGEVYEPSAQFKLYDGSLEGHTVSFSASRRYGAPDRVMAWGLEERSWLTWYRVGGVSRGGYKYPIASNRE